MKEICKHNQTGYCKHGNHCKRKHVNEICPYFKNCSENTCALRHPKTCRYFSMYQYCKFENCAYAHSKVRNMENLEKIENEFEELKSEIHAMKEKNNMLENKIRNINEQLSTTFSIVFKRLLDLEKGNPNEKQAALNGSATGKITSEPEVAFEEIETKKNNVKKKSTKYHKYKCNQCNFTGKNQTNVNKHMNKKHNEIKTHQDERKDVLEFECSLCEDMFSNKKDLEDHMSEHLEDISKMDIDSLKSGHEIYECTLCPFESGHNDSIREHLVEHVMASMPTEEKCDTNKDAIPDNKEKN